MEQVATDVLQPMKIWTIRHNPWVMGGRVDSPIATTVVPTSGPHAMPFDNTVYVVTNPAGGVHIIEASTGGMVGTSLDEVRQGLEQSNAAEISEQLEEAAVVAASAKVLTPDEFWDLFPDVRKFKTSTGAADATGNTGSEDRNTVGSHRDSTGAQEEVAT